jgi:hypothetical protein
MTNIVIIALAIAPLGWSETVVWHHDGGADQGKSTTAITAQALGAWLAVTRRAMPGPDLATC